MPKVTSSDDRERRERFARWFGLVNDRSTHAVERAFREQKNAGEGNDYRATLRAWKTGTRTISPENAYCVGMAMFALGVRWCSGPVALVASAYLPEFVDVLSSLAASGRASHAAALLYTSEPAIENDARAQELLKQLPRLENMLHAGSQMPRTRKADRAFTFARSVAQSSEATDERMRGIIYQLDDYFNYRATWQARNFAGNARSIRDAWLRRKLLAAIESGHAPQSTSLAARLRWSEDHENKSTAPPTKHRITSRDRGR